MIKHLYDEIKARDDEEKSRSKSGKSFQFWKLHYLLAGTIITKQEREKEKKQRPKFILTPEKVKKKKDPPNEHFCFVIVNIVFFHLFY